MSDLVEIGAKVIGDATFTYNGQPETIRSAIWGIFGTSTRGLALVEALLKNAAEAHLAAIEKAGHRIVPVEPTKEMIEAGYDMQVADWPPRWSDDGCTPEKYTAQNIWPAMLNAAPKVTA
jgi:hypothetical protein